MSCWAVSVHAGFIRDKTLRVNPSCLAAPGTRLIPGHSSGMRIVVVVGEVRRQDHESALCGCIGAKMCLRVWCAWITRCFVM